MWAPAVQEGVRVIAAESASNEAAPPAQGGGLLGDPRVARLGFALQLVLQATRGGENVCVGCLAPTLAALLPFLLRVQVLVPRPPPSGHPHIKRVGTCVCCA